MADFASEHFAREADPDCIICQGEGFFYGGERGETTETCECVTGVYPPIDDGPKVKCCDDDTIHVKPYTMEEGRITSWQFYCSACTQIKLIVSDEVFNRMEVMK